MRIIHCGFNQTVNGSTQARRVLCGPCKIKMTVASEWCIVTPYFCSSGKVYLGQITLSLFILCNHWENHGVVL